MSSASNNKPILYSYFRSSCTWRVRMALAYKGIEYEMRYINLLKGDQLGQDYLKVNPSGLLPAFITKDGQLITQSIAIMEYLEEEYPDKHILPKDPATRAKVREVCAIISSGIQPIQNLCVMKKHSQKENEKFEWARYWISKGFQELEPFLAKYSGKYCVGDEISMADFCLVPQVYNANRFKASLEDLPNISRLNETLINMEIFAPARPEAQVDFPPDLKA